MDFLELAQSRRSIRNFQEKDISRDDVDVLLKAAQAAPSGGNRQPWHFYVVRDTQIKADIADKAARQPFIKTAPVIIVVCADAPQSGRRYGERGETLYCIQDTAAAIQNMLLCAKSLGLGSCWCGAFDESAVSGILGLAAELRPIAVIPFGYPGDEPLNPATRRPPDEVVTYIG